MIHDCLTRSGRCLAVAVMLLGSAACGGGDEDAQALRDRVAELEAEQSASPPAAVAAEPAPTGTRTPSPSASPTPTLVNFLMPNLVAANLQEAQDKVQELGVFLSISHDLLGSRSQVLDSNWKVCTQMPTSGTRISGPAEDFEGKFDFGAVKLTENCP